MKLNPTSRTFLQKLGGKNVTKTTIASIASKLLREVLEAAASDPMLRASIRGDMRQMARA